MFKKANQGHGWRCHICLRLFSGLCSVKCVGSPCENAVTCQKRMLISQHLRSRVRPEIVSEVGRNLADRRDILIAINKTRKHFSCCRHPLLAELCSCSQRAVKTGRMSADLHDVGKSQCARTRGTV